MNKGSTYTAKDIEVLEGLEPVRKRPGMYVGGTEGPQGLHHLIKEILDNSIDEAMNGHADAIKVVLDEDLQGISIEDNGRGIPVDIHPKHKKPALEIILTTLHSGGKFSENNYVSAGGLHGVGASVVNALSERLSATVHREGFEWHQEFSRGKAVGGLKKVGKSKKRGTIVHFRPDPEIFRVTKFAVDRVEKILQEKAFLNRGLRIQLLNRASQESKEFCYEDGINSYLTHLLEKNTATAVAGEKFYLERANGIKIETAFAWTEGTNEKFFSYVNGIYTAQGGTHEDGLKAGIAKAIRNYLSVHDCAPKGIKIGGDDIREGMICVLSIFVPGAVSQLQFQGQTKDRLNNPELEAPVDSLARTFENVLNSKPSVANAIIERISLAAKARSAARSASDGVSRKIGVSHRLNLPGKLADCSSTRPDQCEIFIVEGDSAGGTAKQCRDRKVQAVLPLRGKVLNTIAANEGKLKENKELSDLVSVLGCGIGPGLKLERLRYGTVVILTDADADGMHIASLLMAFFFQFMRPLVANGHLYLARSPLYRFKIGSGAKEEIVWVYSDEEKDKLLKGKYANRSVAVSRFKGLGEMDSKDLWDTTLNPAKRSLLRVGFEQEQEVSGILENLFGKDTSERYRMIQDNAHRLELDY